MKEMLETLLGRLKGANKTVFMGIGEEKMSDDGVGPYIISELLEFSDEKFLFMNAGIDPVSRIDEVIEFHPSHLVILDTCTFKGPPGTVALIERENIAEYVPISTHTLPIHVVIDLIIEKLHELSIFMIGIVPESLEGFKELILFKENEYSIDDRSENIDLPFFNIQLTDTIKNVANEMIIIIKELIQIL